MVGIKGIIFIKHTRILKSTDKRYQFILGVYFFVSYKGFGNAFEWSGQTASSSQTCKHLSGINRYYTRHLSGAD